jgi:glucose-1-phosphate cytidylyltransferase
MKVVILAGGQGTRISEESHLKPKPMVEIGERPILWHIMKIYSHYGFNDFIICLGYKGYAIKEYFSNYYLHHSDITFDFSNDNTMQIHSNIAEPWRVTLVDTGLETMTGGRIKRIQKYIGNETFMLTYGDGVGDVDIPETIKLHKQRNALATVTAVQPSGRYGALVLDKEDTVGGFHEKPAGDGNWINAGFFVFEPQIFDNIDNDSTILEREPLERLAQSGQMVAYKHEGFWSPMDTKRDKERLEEMWVLGNASWKVW